MKRIFKGFITIIIIAAIVLTVVKVIDNKKNKGVYFNDIAISEDDYLDRLKYEKSEIPGLTKYDKYKMGLSPEVDDTDHDGLTDADELNVYHSDATKKSTAGDFYTDKYKIDNGMDVNKKYDYEGDLEFKRNECAEITLNPKTIDDLYAVVEDAGIEENIGIEAYKRYRIYNFSSNLTLDLSDIIKDTGVDAKDIGAYLYRLGENTTKAKTSLDGNMLSVNDNLNPDSIYYLYIVNTKNEKSKDIKETIDDLNALLVEDVEDNAQCLVVMRPIISFLASLFGQESSVSIYYVDSSDTFARNLAINQSIAVVNNIIAKKNFYTMDSPCVKLVSQEEYDALVLKCEAKNAVEFVTDHKFDGNVIDQELAQYFTWCYFDYNTIANYDYSGIPAEPGTVSYTFNPDNETLPFGNFATEISTEGSCMGIARLTAKLHNQRINQPSGSLYINDTIGTVQWDLTQSDENATLLDPMLSDYKDDKFVKERTGRDMITKPNNDAEKQFLNMIGCYWKEGNDIMKKQCAYKIRGYGNYSQQIIHDVMKYLDDDKVAICGMGQTSGGHAVNIYGYEKLDDYTVSFLVYDSNYPTLKNGELRLNIYFISAPAGDDGSPATFEYEYVTPKYTITSLNKQRYFLAFMDEDLNFISSNAR